MTLQNSTNYSDSFLRKMVSWCCQEMGLPVTKVRRCRFTKCHCGARGRAWQSMRFLVRIGGGTYPSLPWVYRGQTVNSCTDEMMKLVQITAHELFHLCQWHDGARRYRDRPEIGTVWMGNLLAQKFDENRHLLLPQWLQERQRPANVIPIPQWRKRADKTANNLERWQRKLKLAQTKIRKLKARVHYYDKRQAAMAPPTPPTL